MGKICIGHIGDGIVVGMRNGELKILSSPDTGEYANETACLVETNWEHNLRITQLTEVDQCIIATDGCQGALAIRKEGKFQPYEPFILPLLSFISKKIGMHENPDSDIAGLLASQRMQEFSGDDKTLVVLVNPHHPDHPEG